jgi:hypothetical protein
VICGVDDGGGAYIRLAKRRRIMRRMELTGMEKPVVIQVEAANHVCDVFPKGKSTRFCTLSAEAVDVLEEKVLFLLQQYSQCRFGDSEQCRTSPLRRQVLHGLTVGMFSAGAGCTCKSNGVGWKSALICMVCKKLVLEQRAIVWKKGKGVPLARSGQRELEEQRSL